MIDDKVIYRIKENLRRGVPIETIRVDLLASGFSDEQINEAINLARQAPQSNSLNKPPYPLPQRFPLQSPTPQVKFPQQGFPVQQNTPLQQTPLLTRTEKSNKILIFSILILLILAVLAVVYFVFFSERVGFGEEPLTPYEIKMSAVKVMEQNLTSYFVEAISNGNIIYRENNTERRLTMETVARGHVNVADKKAVFNVSMEMSSSGLMFGSQNEVYIVNDYIYMKIFDSWIKERTDEDIWKDYDKTNDFVNALKSGTINITGEENISVYCPDLTSSR